MLKVLTFAAVIFSVAATSQTLAQRDFSGVEIKTSEVAPGVYMLQGAGGNIGLSVGEDGAFVIDDQFAPLSEKIMAAIREVTDQPVEYVLNTHHHGDHAGGNENFSAAGAHIIAHDNVRKRLADGTQKHELGAVSPAAIAALPVITFSDTATFYQNGHEIYIFHPENAHTDGDAIVYFRDIDVMHMGDVFFSGRYPYIDIGGGGGINGYIAALEMTAAMITDETVIIPGHGPLSGKTELLALIEVLHIVRDRIQKSIDDGLDEDAAVAADLLADLNETWSWQFINGEKMTRIAYKSLAAE